MAAMTLDELREMVKMAHEACKAESMFCPWCSGHIAPDEESHDQFCPWPRLKLGEGNHDAT